MLSVFFFLNLFSSAFIFLTFLPLCHPSCHLIFTPTHLITINYVNTIYQMAWGYSTLFGFIFLLFGHATWHAGSLFPDQWLNLRALQRKHGILTTRPPGKSLFNSLCYFNIFVQNTLVSLYPVPCRHSSFLFTVAWYSIIGNTTFYLSSPCWWLFRWFPILWFY